MTELAAAVPLDRRWRFDGEEIAPGRVTLRRLGGGGEYEVYLVWDDRLCAAVAAKLVRPDRLDSASARRHLEREADLLDHLAHPSLPRCFGRALDADAPHILLEHLEGPPLSRVIEKFGAVDVDQLLPMAIQLAGAMHFFAASGHVHLDVKPSNVVMTSVPKLIDLSLARTLREAAEVDGVIGTPGYLSPEQCLAHHGALVGSAADVWGLGVTLYEAIEGVRPFRKVEWKEVCSDQYPQVHDDARPMRHPVPADVEELVMQCLAWDPAARPSAAEIVVRLERHVA